MLQWVAIHNQPTNLCCMCLIKRLGQKVIMVWLICWLNCSRCAPWRIRRLCVCWCQPSPWSRVSCVALFYPASSSCCRVWWWTRPLWLMPSSRPSSETPAPMMWRQTGTVLFSSFSDVFLLRVFTAVRGTWFRESCSHHCLYLYLTYPFGIIC